MIEMLWRKLLLSTSQLKLLTALANGASLKSHRFLDGAKFYQLRQPDGPIESIPQQVVDALVTQSLIYSNQKFPAATYSLTEAGRAAVIQWTVE